MWGIRKSGQLVVRWENGRWETGSGGGPKTAEVFQEDDRGRFWIVDRERRLWMREGGKWESWPLPETMENQAYSLAVSADGTLWIAFFREGLLGFRSGVFFPPQVAGDFSPDLTEIVTATPDGLLWVGTSTNGLYSLKPGKLELAVLEEGKGGHGVNFIGALVETAPGEFVVGTQGYGFFRWKARKAEPLLEAVGKNVGLYGNALEVSDDGAVWAGTSTGLYRITPQSGMRLVPGPPGVWDLRQDPAGNLWIGGGNGELFRLSGDTADRVAYGRRTGAGIKGLCHAPDGALWIGTRGDGLFRLKDGKSERYGMAEGLGSEVIRVISVEEDGTVWVGTAGGGLSVSQGKRFLTITTAAGLPDDIVSQIAFDARGRLWVGTNHGIAVIPRWETDLLRKGETPYLHPLSITRSDGLVSEECSIVPPVKTSDGRMAFATIHGFAILRPEDFQPDETTPPVFIERVRANGKEVIPAHGKLKLPPGSQRLEIEFTGLHFTAPSRLQFRNRLTGLEEEWGMPSIERRVEYRNLTPGKYRFELAGSIGNGLWTPSPAALEINIAPFFWQTGWFGTLAVVFLLGGAACLTFAVERFRSRKKIERLKRERAVQEERARIARDLHDDVSASLSYMAFLSELAEGDLSADAPETARHRINEIFATCQETTRALDEIVWAVNPEQDTLEGFAVFLNNFVENYARAAQLETRLFIPVDLPFCILSPAVRHHLYLATKETLHNTIKHAAATEIRLKIAADSRELLLTISDNGKGFSLVERDREGDGIGNLRNRLALIHGSCSIRSSADGTTVEMRVTLKHLTTPHSLPQ